jgi:hypothetical protein
MTEINPYASPASSGGYESGAGPGIGVWSDGNTFVMHQRATLPEICIETGLPAVRYRRFGMLWSYPIDWSTRRLYLRLPLCESAFRRYRREWFIGVAAILLPLCIAVGAFVIFGERFPPLLTLGLMFLSPSGVVVWVLLRWRNGHPVRFVRVYKDYFWISGAAPQFLGQLPRWGS